MLYFPQLSTGAIAQYPIEKRLVARTVVNEASDGARVKFQDPGATAVEWTLSFETLTGDEQDALWKLHNAVEGRLGTFTFLDPTDNLLRWSGKLDEEVWERNSLMSVGSVTGPGGAVDATRVINTGGAALAIQQTVNAPGWFKYAFGLQARSDTDQQITLVRSTATQAQAVVFQIGQEWQRILLSGKFSGTEDSVSFGIEVGSGQSVDLFGIQVEAQAGASGYKRTSSQCGVYPQARFMDDDFSATSDGPDQHSCRVRVHARL